MIFEIDFVENHKHLLVFYNVTLHPEMVANLIYAFFWLVS